MLEVGVKAPDFELPDQNGKIHRLSDYTGKKVILYFYPKDNTAGCTKQAFVFWRCIKSDAASLKNLISSVRSEDKGNVGYIRISSFSETTTDDVKKAVEVAQFLAPNPSLFVFEPNTTMTISLWRP